MRNIDSDRFAGDLSRLPLINDPPSSELSAAVDAYYSELNNLLDEHAPIQERSTTLRPHAPWYSDSLRSLKREKRRSERKWVRSGLEIHKQIHRETSKRYYDAIKEAKQTYYKNKVMNSDQKQLFQLIDGLFKIKGTHILPSHDSAQVLAQRFCKFYADKVSALRCDLAKIPPKSTTVHSICV